MKIKIVGNYDSLGRVMYVKTWYDESPAYCLTCGKCVSMNCKCFNDKKQRSQYFFGKPDCKD